MVKVEDAMFMSERCISGSHFFGCPHCFKGFLLSFWRSNSCIFLWQMQIVFLEKWGSPYWGKIPVGLKESFASFLFIKVVQMFTFFLFFFLSSCHKQEALCKKKLENNNEANGAYIGVGCGREKKCTGSGGGGSNGVLISPDPPLLSVSCTYKGGLFWFLFPWVQARFTYM